MRPEMYGKKENYGLWYELYKMALHGMNVDLTGDIHLSGEENVCHFLRSMGMVQTVFDVGANIGNYTSMLEQYFPNAEIHCFEPAKETFFALKTSIGNNKSVVLNNVGISDKAGKSTLYYDREKSGLASLYERQLDYYNIDFTKNEEVSLITLDEYCSKNGIKYIDFLKMDIEGNEFKALIGAEQLLKNKRIRTIQIEFGGCNIDSRTYFKDFWNLLHESYCIYRILQNGFWEITNYTERLECFCNTNYFFVSKELDDMQRRIVEW